MSFMNPFDYVFIYSYIFNYYTLNLEILLIYMTIVIPLNFGILFNPTALIISKNKNLLSWQKNFDAQVISLTLKIKNENIC